MGQFLTTKAKFSATPVLTGDLEFQPTKGEPLTVAVIHRYVANQGTAWDLTLTAVQRFFEVALARDLLWPHLTGAALLGQRTAQSHEALAVDSDDPAKKVFAQSPMSKCLE